MTDPENPVMTSAFQVDVSPIPTWDQLQQTKDNADQAPSQSDTATKQPVGKLRSCMQRVFRPQTDPKLDLAVVVLAAVVYGALYFSMGSAFLPGHAAWCTLLLWASALIGGFIAHQLYLPRVIGMLVAGMLLTNIPWSAIDAFPKKWGVQMRAAALATIFLRCGLELDFGTMRKFKYPAIRLALIPGLTEALYAGGLGVALFKMDYLLGLTMGFILKAVGPGLVVPQMFRLQKTGLGTDQGIPSTVVIAASFDDVIAITGYSIFSTLAIQPDSSSDGDTNVAWEIASGPLQVIFGIVGGVLAGTILGATKVWNTKTKRLVGLYGSVLLLMFFLEYYNLLSGGALASLFAGLVASNAWEKGFPRCGSLGPSFRFSPEIERVMGVLWVWVLEPILFVTVGSTLDFSTLDSGTIPRSLVIIVTGAILRIISTFAVMSGFRYTVKERLFYAVAWTPKATVQAALSAAPLALVEKYKTNSPDYDQWVTWGNDILTTGLFTIIICGTLGVLAIHYCAPVLLLQSESEQETSSGEDDDIPSDIEPSRDAISGPAVLGDVLSSGEVRTLSAGSLEAERVARIKKSQSAAAVLSMNNRPSSPDRSNRQASASLVPREDYELLAEYIDAIRQLTAVTAGTDTQRWITMQPEVQRLSNHVLYMQQRIETEVGQREPSVRELFRTASNLSSARRPGYFGLDRRRSIGGGPRVGVARRGPSPQPSRDLDV